MSWAELDAWLTGYTDKVESDWQMVAQLSAWLLSPHTKRALKSTDFYKPRSDRNRPESKPAIPSPDELTRIVHERLKWLQ
jgi:hypothetical protein